MQGPHEDTSLTPRPAVRSTQGLPATFDEQHAVFQRWFAERFEVRQGPPVRVATPYPVPMGVEEERTETIPIYAPRPVAPNQLVSNLNSWGTDVSCYPSPGSIAGPSTGPPQARYNPSARLQYGLSGPAVSHMTGLERRFENEDNFY
jgi:hypothetical protein